MSRRSPPNVVCFTSLETSAVKKIFVSIFKKKRGIWWFEDRQLYWFPPCHWGGWSMPQPVLCIGEVGLKYIGICFITVSGIVHKLLRSSTSWFLVDGLSLGPPPRKKAKHGSDKKVPHFSTRDYLFPCTGKDKRPSEAHMLSHWQVY